MTAPTSLNLPRFLRLPAVAIGVIYCRPVQTTAAVDDACERAWRTASETQVKLANARKVIYQNGPQAQPTGSR